ncbi:Malonyl-CoA decarboxylase, mitochondrial [Galdieria sulphuraria]|nr:Malonyl-CoA decarboxylase, mitochondrial [Galdieria sulphuraria]
MRLRSFTDSLVSLARTKYVEKQSRKIVFDRFSVVAKDSCSSQERMLPSELATKYVQSLMKRATLKVETSKSTNDYSKVKVSNFKQKDEEESDRRLISQVRAMFASEQVDISPWVSSTRKYQEIFCQHVANLLAHHMNKLLLEPRARLVQNFMQDFTLSELEVLERLKRVNLDISLLEEQTEAGEYSLHSALDMNSDPLLVAREMMTSPVFKVLWRILNSNEGFMALLFLRGTLSLNRNAISLQGCSGRQLRYHVNQICEQMLQSDLLVFESGSLESNGRSLMFTLNDWREEWGIRRTMHDLVDRLYRGYRFYNLKHKLIPSYSLGTLHFHFASSIPINDESILKTSIASVDKRAQHSIAVINHIRVRSFIGGLGMEQQFINHIITTELRENSKYLGDIYTLSPIPYFVPWLFHQMKLYSKVIEGDEWDTLVLTSRDAAVVEDILNWLKSSTQDPHHVKQIAQLEQRLIRGKETLMKLVSYFLLNAKGRRMRCLDSVARMHFSNGAELYRINFMADLSRRRLRQSLGITVNYRYKQKEQEKNILNFYENDNLAVAEEAIRLQQLANLVDPHHCASSL